jgi:hypothetical protein
MSFLRGPLTRGQIKQLMDPRREEFGGGAAAGSAAANPMAMPGLAAAAAPGERPVVGAGVTECFLRPAGGGADLVYQPHLLRKGLVAFSSAKAGVDGSRTVTTVHPILEGGIDWEHAVQPAPNADTAEPQPGPGAGFGPLPGFAMNAANYKQVEKDFAEWLFRNERAEVFCCKALKEYSTLGESEADFRARLQLQAREARDAACDKLRAATDKRVAALESRLRTAEARLSKEKAESTSAKIQMGASVLGGVLSGLFGRKLSASTLSRGSSAVGKATSAFKQSQDVATAERAIAELQSQIDAARQELEAEVEKIAAALDPATLPLETESLSPTRTNVRVLQVALLWLPFDSRGGRAW